MYRQTNTIHNKHKTHKNINSSQFFGVTWELDNKQTSRPFPGYVHMVPVEFLTGLKISKQSE